MPDRCGRDPRSPLILLVTFLIARPLFAAYASRDLVFPIIGRAVAAGGRTFQTTIWITNVSSHAATATISFLEAGHANRSPRKLPIELAPGATRIFDPLEATPGAARIESNADLVASARIFTDEFATSYPAVPSRFAIGSRQSAVLQGYGSGAGRYRLYVVEITGEPLTFSVTVSDTNGRMRGEKRLFIDSAEQSQFDLTEMLPGVEGSVVKIEGINGNGKIVAMGLQRAAGAQDASAFEMSFPSPSRFAMSWIEGATYAIVALAVLAIAVIRR